jgi:hypothetical protein
MLFGMACAQDYDAFYQEEIRYRQKPFVSAIHRNSQSPRCMVRSHKGSRRRSGTAANNLTRRIKPVLPESWDQHPHHLRG